MVSGWGSTVEFGPPADVLGLAQDFVQNEDFDDQAGINASMRCCIY
jgi:hypothetical protein